MSNVLIVGGAGYIGGALTDLLMNSQHNLRVYDNLLYEESYRKPVDFVRGDIRDIDRLQPHLKWADTVVWLAALVGDGACALEPQVTTAINDSAVKCLSENYDGKIIFTSTCSVYGAQDGILTEESPESPLSVYATTKLSAENYLKRRNAQVFRLGTLFGLGDTYSRIRFDLVVNILTVKALLEEEITVFGGDQYRPLLHVKDIGRAIFENVDSEYSGTYNLHFENIRIASLAGIFVEKFPNLNVKIVDMKFEDNRNYRVSSEKAISKLGFDPQFGIDQGIDELREVIEEGRIGNVENHRHSNYQFLKNISPNLSSSPNG